MIADVGDVPDFHEIQSDRHGLQIGAFADIEHVAREPLIRSALGDAPFGPDAARFRLGALGAQLIIAGMGSTRTARLDTLSTPELPQNEIPLTGAMIAKGTFAGAARHAADAFRGDDEKTNVLRRTIIPLVLSALKEAYDSSRTSEPPKRKR